MLFNMLNHKESHWFRGLKAAEEEHRTTGSLQCVYHILRDVDNDCQENGEYLDGVRDYVSHQLNRVPMPKPEPRIWLDANFRCSYKPII